MTDTQQTKPAQTQAQSVQPRGAGTGANANATRSRNIVDWPPEPKTHAEHVDELLQKAQDNEDYNNEMNAAQTEQITKMRDTIGHPQGDPANDDDAREQSREAFLDSTDPERKKARLKGEMEARAKRDRAQVAAATGAK